MFFKRTVLLLLACASIILFFNIPVYKDWLNKRVLALRENIHDELGMDIEHRKVYRWGDTYTVTKAIKHTIEEKSKVDPFVIVPTAAYVSRSYPNVLFPEPLTFYYFTGMKAVLPTSPDVSKANCQVIISDNHLMVQEVKGPVTSAEILKTYN